MGLKQSTVNQVMINTKVLWVLQYYILNISDILT